MQAPRRSPIRTPALLAAIVAIAAGAPAGAQSRGAQVDTRWTLDPATAVPGSTVHATLHVEVEKTYHVQSDKPLDEFLVPTTLTLTAPAGIVVQEIVYPRPVMLKVEYDPQPLSVFEHAFDIRVAFQVGKDVRQGAHPVKGVLQYQACDDKKCLNPASRDVTIELKVEGGGTASTGSPPAGTGGDIEEHAAPPTVPPPAPPAGDCDVLATLDRFTVAGTAGGYMKSGEFLSFIDSAERGTARANALAGKAAIVVVLYTILWGLGLNLTPCVLPLIPINLAIIGAGAKAGSRKRGFGLGGTYGLAMAAVYGLLGLIVILSATAFGAINSTIWFNAAIAGLFVVLGLAMFDIIHIDFSALQGRLNLAGSGRKGSFALAFGMGAVSALLAGACVAPVVIYVIVYASDQYAKGSTIALALPFLLGLGMALPWPFAGAGLSLLPKPGRWMVRVKQAMGVFIFAFAVYYGYVAWEIYGARAAASGPPGAAAATFEDGWTRSICAGLSQAESEQKPVLIDMWATWCKNCFAMDRTTFKDPEVVRRLEGYVKIKFQAEDLDATPAREMLERFGGIGLPHYAILKPPGEATK